MPDLALVSTCQCFPRYRYERRIASSVSRAGAPASPSPSSSPTACPTSTSSSSGSASRAGSSRRRGGAFDEGSLFPTELERVDNITDDARERFRRHYADDGITKDGIFDYVYGVLHAPAWRERFRNDLTKELPRIPFAPDFRAFASAGRQLAALHLGYETGPEFPLDLVFEGDGEPRPEHFRLGQKAMKLEGPEQDILRVNEHIRLRGIPATAHEYLVNGRTPLGWFIDRYRVKQDRRSGIVNDANGWWDDPRDLIAAIRRIVHVSVETVRIVDGLPEVEL